MTGPHSNAGNLVNKIRADGGEDLSSKELAEEINKAFLEPLQNYRLQQPPTRLPSLLCPKGESCPF